MKKAALPVRRTFAPCGRKRGGRALRARRGCACGAAVRRTIGSTTAASSPTVSGRVTMQGKARAERAERKPSLSSCFPS